MSKYELALVVNAKIEDDERTAVVDKCKALIERFGGTITNVDKFDRVDRVGDSGTLIGGRPLVKIGDPLLVARSE